MAQLDEHKLQELVGKMLGDLGGAFSVPTVRLGLRLGLFEALNDGPITANELARCAGGLTERYVREWALAQAANGYVDYDPTKEAFSLSPEQAMIFAVKDSPVYLAGAFDLVAAMIEGEPKVENCFRTGAGVRWGDSAGCLFCATGAFFRPGYVNNIVQTWLPALEGVEDKLKSGAKVADIGCGVGFSTLLMADAFPNSRFIGFDFHEPSIEEASRHAKAHGVADRVSFEARLVKEIADSEFDLVTAFDCLHDMGDPRGCARQVRRMLKDDGAWMIVEPIAGDARRTISIRWDGSITTPRLCSASQPRWTRRSAKVSEPRQARRGSARSSGTAASPGSVGQPRGRSTWCSRPAPELRTTPGRRCLRWVELGPPAPSWKAAVRAMVPVRSVWTWLPSVASSPTREGERHDRRRHWIPQRAAGGLAEAAGI